MDELLVFFAEHGLPMTIFAVLGVTVLGILKYCGAFSKLNKETRHYIYFAISMGTSLIASLIYLLCVKSFDWNYFAILAAAIYALNQAFYSIFEVTSLNDLVKMIIEWVISLLQKGITCVKNKVAAKKAAKNK